jgi:deoxycytidine triphosphate deaminase
MTLLTHDEIKARHLFSQPSTPYLHIKATSVDLTIGVIIDNKGNKYFDGYTLEAGEMVQVISLERFSLPSNVTALVSYKTTMTRKGIWALTVGLVDPGWDGYVSTTLLNFSKVSVRLHPGQEFLRSSFFEHKDVDKKFQRKSASKTEYVNGIVAGATTDFPPKFLDQDNIAERAGKHAADKMRNVTVQWAAAIAIVMG